MRTPAPAMELKVWVDGVQRIVCGVTEYTTCQEVVIALAQAIGRTGRYTLIEKWRETERHLAPLERPVASLNTWGPYAGDVQLVLRRTGPSVSERPASDSLRARGLGLGPERGPYRQSLPPLAKLRPSANGGVGSGERGGDRSLKRREPKRKSLTFSGGARGLRDIFGKSRGDAEAKQSQQQQQQQQHQRTGVHLSLTRVQCVGVGVGVPGYASLPGSPVRELGLLVGLQRDTLQALEVRLAGREAELRDWEEVAGEANEHAAAYEEELLLLQQRLQKSEAEVEEEEAGEEEFWASELRAEQESERRLRLRLAELQARVHDCSARLQEHLARVQTMEAGLEQERLQQEAELNQLANEEEVKAQLAAVRAELEAQGQHSSRLESSCRALERSLGHASQKLQEKEQELEQLTKELRQVNLQQFIQQTGTKVTVLPAQPGPENTHEVDSGSLKRLGSARMLPSDLRALQSSASSSLNPEGIYV